MPIRRLNRTSMLAGAMLGLASAGLSLLSGCSEPTAAGPALAPTGAAQVRAASTSGPTVSSLTPPEAPRDTTLNVQITGSGFDRGSVAQFTLQGTPDARVKVNATTYVKPTQITANVTIAADAVPSVYDVAVTTSSGKKGIGTELFAVLLRGELLAGGAHGFAVNASGDVAGWGTTASSCSPTSTSYVWHLDGSRSTLPLIAPYCGSNAEDINGSGVVLAALFGGAGDASGLWTPTGGGYVLQEIPPTSDGIRPVALALNDAGEVTGWHEGSARLFWWSLPTGWLSVQAPAGATLCVLYGINNLGAMVGNCSIGGGAREGYYWSDHTAAPVQLPRPGAGDVTPQDVNDSGVIVGYLYGSPSRAVRWTPSGSGFTVGYLPDLGAGGSAYSIAGDGTVAGSVNAVKGSSTRPAIWLPQSATPSLLQIPSGSYGEAADVVLAPSGIIVSGYASVSGSKQAMRWKAAP